MCSAKARHNAYKCVKLRPNAQKELIFVPLPTAQLVVARVILGIRFTCELFLFDTLVVSSTIGALQTQTIG